jgi:parallel beta-helix repeat protein
MRNIDRRLLLCGIVVALVQLSPLHADEGRIPIWQPIVITPGPGPGFHEGKYILTRDVSAIPGMPVVDILGGTVAVDIDLNGFTMYGLDADVIRASGVDSLTIANGTIMGGLADGILAADCRKVVIRDLKIEFVRGIGIHLATVDNFAVRRNMLVAHAALPMVIGILVDGIPAPTPLEGVLEGNHVSGALTGLSVNVGSSVAIRDNRIEDAGGGDGIRVSVCDACIVAENTVQRAVGRGIVLESVNVNKIYNNLVFGAVEGIALVGNSSDCLVLHNDASQNTGSGLVVDGQRNRIQENVFNFNGTYGIWFQGNAGGNTFGRNTARGNQMMVSPCMFTPAPCAPPDVCDDGMLPGSNTSFGDNMGPGPGC